MSDDSSSASSGSYEQTDQGKRKRGRPPGKKRELVCMSNDDDGTDYMEEFETDEFGEEKITKDGFLKGGFFIIIRP
jgi:hypothetical protein